MNKPSQFLPILKQNLGLYRFGPIPLLLWFTSFGIVLYFSANTWPIEWARGFDGPDTATAQLLPTVGLWLFLMFISTPVPVQILGGTMSLEFMFTRAVDRGIWLRAERVALIVVVAAPLFINLLASPWETPLALQPATSGTPEAAVQHRYMETFPGSVNGVWVKEEGPHSPQIIIHHGTEMFATWMCWSALVLIFVVAGYFSIVFTTWQRAGWHHSKSRWRPWLGGAMVNAPAFSVVPLLLLGMALKVNLYEECFLLFARHPLWCLLFLVALIAIVQPFSERNLRKLEFEFT